jgi:ubiquinone biosynthesis UbiH/UbiF/VisC/COQ6 family hydroxylase
LKVVIIGGGSIGLASALVCKRAGHTVTVFDPAGFELRRAALEMDSRVWALGPQSQGLLEDLEAWHPDDRICAYQSIRVIDARSDARVTFTDPTLGHMVEADWVRNQLLREVSRTDIRCIQQSVQATTPNGLITIDNDTTIDADLVVFAEGRTATTAIASGFEIVDGGYHQRAVVGTLHSQRPHHGEAFQIFTEHGPLALLPLPDCSDQHRVSLVWSLGKTVADDLQQNPKEILASLISKTSEFERGDLRFVADPRWIPLSQQSLKQDALGCLLAIGDTSHGILPLAGLGANLGFADVLALRATVERHPKAGGDRIARSVARERCVDQRTVALVMGLFSDVFRSDLPLMQLGRSFALRTANQYPMIQSLIKEMAG